MPPVIQTFTTYAIQSVTALGNMTLLKPSGVQDGDLLIAIICLTENLSSAAAGWTLIKREATGGASTINVYTYQKIASGEPSSWNFVIGNSNASCAGAVLRITSFDTTTPVDANNGAAVASGTTLAFTETITPTRDNSLLIFIIYALSAASTLSSMSGYQIATDNPTWNELIDINNGGGSLICFAVATAQRPQTTATGNATVTANRSIADSGSVLLSVKRSLIITASVTDIQHQHDVIATTRTRLASVTDVQPTSDNVSAERQKIWNNTSKPADTWGDNQIKR